MNGSFQDDLLEETRQLIQRLRAARLREVSAEVDSLYRYDILFFLPPLILIAILLIAGWSAGWQVDV